MYQKFMIAVLASSFIQATVPLGAQQIGSDTIKSVATPAGQETLTNDTVISLAQGGIGDTVLISKIQESSCKFDVTTSALLALKKAGVSDPVIQAMLQATTPVANVTVKARANSSNDPQSPHDAGIYSYDGSIMTELEPTVYSGAKVGGIFTSALTYGIASANMKAVVRSPRASTRLAPSVIFYFYFEQASSGLSNVTGVSSYFAGATSPNEFVLLRMERKSRDREVSIGSFSAWHSSTGTNTKDTIDFTSLKLAPGVYKVTASGLKPGEEYCFFYGSSSTQHKLFDFGVD